MLAPRPLRAEGPSAPCSWPASAVLVTSAESRKVEPVTCRCLLELLLRKKF